MRKKVVRPPKEKFSWTNEILKLEVDGEPLRTDEENAKAIRPLLSREIKIKDPNRAFKTDIVTEPGYLLLYRIA